MPVEQRWEERQALETHGLLALEQVEQHEPNENVRGLRPLLRLWHYPSFLAYTSWTVFDPPDTSHNRLVRQVRWDRPHDMLRFSDPPEGVKQGFNAPPSLSIGDVHVADDTLQKYVAELSSLLIPVLGIRDMITLDGTVSGLQAYGNIASSRLQWWGEGPNAWSAFTAAVTHLRSYLAEQFAGDRGSW
jgi:hypothetical protein